MQLNPKVLCNHDTGGSCQYKEVKHVYRWFIDLRPFKTSLLIWCIPDQTSCCGSMIT